MTDRPDDFPFSRHETRKQTTERLMGAINREKFGLSDDKHWSVMRRRLSGNRVLLGTRPKLTPQEQMRADQYLLDSAYMLNRVGMEDAIRRGADVNAVGSVSTQSYHKYAGALHYIFDNPHDRDYDADELGDVRERAAKQLECFKVLLSCELPTLDINLLGTHHQDEPSDELIVIQGALKAFIDEIHFCSESNLTQRIPEYEEILRLFLKDPKLKVNDNWFVESGNGHWEKLGNYWSQNNPLPGLFRTQFQAPLELLETYEQRSIIDFLIGPTYGKPIVRDLIIGIIAHPSFNLEAQQELLTGAPEYLRQFSYATSADIRVVCEAIERGIWEHEYNREKQGRMPLKKSGWSDERIRPADQRPPELDSGPSR